MNPSIAAPFETLKLNTRLYLNTLDGVDDATAGERPSDTVNSIIFIACHVLDARGYLANYLGIEHEHPYKQAFDAASTFEEIDPLPPLEGLRTAWRDVSELLVQRWPALGESELGVESSVEFPVEDGTVLGGIAFLLQHESFHIGQLALLRRHFGLEGMAYG
jgi:hypothetical protein